MQNGMIIERTDLQMTHVEAYMIIQMQVVSATDEEKRDIVI